MRTILRTGSRAAAELQSSTHGVVLVLFCRNYVLSCSVGAMDTTRGVHWCTEAAACCIHVAVVSVELHLTTHMRVAVTAIMNQENTEKSRKRFGALFYSPVQGTTG